MTANEFVAWAIEQPRRMRCETVDGQIVEMAAERVEHLRGKQRIFQPLAGAISAAGLPCEAFIDGMAVRVSDTTVYEPDALVRCGELLDGDALLIDDPLVVVEVLSPSSKSRDAGAKLADYFRMARCATT